MTGKTKLLIPLLFVVLFFCVPKAFAAQTQEVFITGSDKLSGGTGGFSPTSALIGLPDSVYATVSSATLAGLNPTYNTFSVPSGLTIDEIDVKFYEAPTGNSGGNVPITLENTAGSQTCHSGGEGADGVNALQLPLNNQNNTLQFTPSNCPQLTSLPTNLNYGSGSANGIRFATLNDGINQSANWDAISMTIIYNQVPGQTSTGDSTGLANAYQSTASANLQADLAVNCNGNVFCSTWQWVEQYIIEPWFTVPDLQQQAYDVQAVAAQKAPFAYFNQVLGDNFSPDSDFGGSLSQTPPTWSFPIATSTAIAAPLRGMQISGLDYNNALTEAAQYVRPWFNVMLYVLLATYFVFIARRLFEH